MDPLLDEKLVLTTMRVCRDYFKETLFVSAEKEAYGPSRNEGLCYESVSRISFEGDFTGHLFLAMDGYTKMKLLPRIAERYQIDPSLKGMASSVLLEFSNQMAALIAEEMRLGGFDLHITTPEDLSHKLVPIDRSLYRQYILIFFLRDRRLKKYLGRLYLILVIQKFPIPEPEPNSHNDAKDPAEL